MGDYSVIRVADGTGTECNFAEKLSIGYETYYSNNLAPRAINTFLETYDFSGKTVIPFATSGGSGITNSAAQLRKEYPALDWQSGKLLNGASRTAIEAWVR